MRVDTAGGNVKNIAFGSKMGEPCVKDNKVLVGRRITAAGKHRLRRRRTRRREEHRFRFKKWARLA